jgi:hypothetical protein
MSEMSDKSNITKTNLDNCFRELSKEYKKLSHAKQPIEIVVVGGASVITNYLF